jgi:hypothetical protein
MPYTVTRFTVEEKKAKRALVAQFIVEHPEMTYEAIALAFSVSMPYIIKLVAEHNLPRRKRGPRKQL